MSIKVARNASGNCVVFYGQTNPVYFNACLSAEVDGEYVSVKNDIASSTTENSDNAVYEFYQLHFSEWVDEEGSSFASAQEVADYINDIGNVTDVPTGGYSFGPADTLDFTRDETNTSILFSNGDHHGINAVKAVLKENGRVGISSIRGDFEFYELDHTSCTIAGASAGNNLNDVVNNLNAYFTMSAFTAPTSAPVYTMTGGQSVTELLGPEAQLLGNDQVASSVSSPSYHGNHVYTAGTDTINEPGEYFTFQIKNEATFLMGLYDTNNQTMVDGLTSAAGSGATSAWWVHGWHPTPNGPWTNYGPGGLIYGPGWNGATDKRFNTSPAGAAWLAGDWVQIKVGIDENGFAYLAYYDDGRSNEWIMTSRSSIAAPSSDYGLIIKIADANGRVLAGNSAGAITRYATDPAAPVLYYKYIESPDGNFNYPLFATQEEAEFVSGDGTAHTHTYVDDPTGTTWYMPNVGGTMDGTSAPTGSEYAEIPSGVDADFVPAVYTQADLTQEEGTVVNLSIQPLDVDYSSSVTISPAGSGLVYNAGTAMLQGTLTDVGADTTYTVTVTRANSYGSSTGSFTITATDVAPVSTNDTNWNKALDFSGSSERTQQVSSSSNYVPLKMNGTSNQVSEPASGQTVNSGYPWATSCVFKIDGNNSNQHIWNLGEGSGSSDDNIYLRLDSNQRLYFGMGRGNEVNECLIHTLSSAWWYGIYVGFNGARYGAAGSTVGRLNNIFDIKLMSSIDSFGSMSEPIDLQTGWSHGASSTGARMDRAFSGDMTLGGRGSNRNFHGKIASFVSTTLPCGVAMPGDAEIEEMITDPIGWMYDYKAGNSYRRSNSTSTSSNFTVGSAFGSAATQIYLMGDGIQDSYSNMIRNQVWSGDQNYTKMNMLSMVSNDIQSVNIPGLS